MIIIFHKCFETYNTVELRYFSSTDQLLILSCHSLHHLFLVMQAGIQGVDPVALLGELLLQRFQLSL